MRALRWHARNDIRLDDVPAPGPPSAGELLLAVEAAGICGTDLEEWRRGPLNIPLNPHPLSGRSAPITLGHETVGLVTAAGEETSIPIGTRVAVEANYSCGRCWWCVRDQRNLCRQLVSKGLSDDGGLAEAMVAPQAMCVPVPDHLDAVTTVLCEPLAVAVRAVDRGQVCSGETAVVLGGGTIGQLAGQLLRRIGAQVLLVEPVAARRALATDRGALAVAPDQAAAAVRERTGDRGADVCIESSGACAAVQVASELTRAGGRVVVVGVNTEPVGLSPLEVIWREQTILGSLSHVLTNFASAVSLLAEHAVDVQGLVSDVIALEDVVERGFCALRDAPAKHLKIVVAPGSPGCGGQR